jgi:hypothetical protein
MAIASADSPLRIVVRVVPRVSEGGLKINKKNWIPLQSRRRIYNKGTKKAAAHLAEEVPEEDVAQNDFKTEEGADADEVAD